MLLVPAIGWSAAALSGGNDAFTKALFHFDGADASSTFPDASASGHTLTAVGNAQIDTAQSKFGSGALQLDGTGDRATAPASPDFNMQAAGDWIIDFWARVPSAGFGVFFQCISGVDHAGHGLVAYHDSGAFHADNGIDGQLSGGAVLNNTWQHIAVIRSGGTVYLAVGGAIVDSGTAQNYGNANSSLMIGDYHGLDFPLAGHIDEFRISKGTDRGWSGGFAPPAAAYF